MDAEKQSNQSPPTFEDFSNQFSCGSIAGYKAENSQEQNEQITKELIAALKAKGYSVAKTEGSYLEHASGSIKDEISLLVVNQQVPVDDGGQLQSDLIALAEQYGIEKIMSIQKGVPEFIKVTPVKDEKLKCGEIQCLGTPHYGKENGQKTYKVNGKPFSFGQQP